MAGPSGGTYPSPDIFPGEWPPVGNGPTVVAIRPYDTRAVITPIDTVVYVEPYDTDALLTPITTIVDVHPYTAEVLVTRVETSVLLVTLISSSEGIPMANRSDFEIKRNDTWRPLEAQLRNVDHTPIDLTDADTVRLRMKSADRTVLTGAVDIIDAEQALVSYEWLAEDLEVEGVYQAEFEIEWNTGAIQTVPNNSYFTIHVWEDLG